MQQGLARLRYLAEQATIALVTGGSGVGKSAPAETVPVRVAWAAMATGLSAPDTPASRGTVEVVSGQAGRVSRRGKERLFEQILQKARQADGGLLVILDEAHLVDPMALVDIRVLISSALDDAPPLKFVLAGQEPLRQTLRQSLHSDLLNRISVRFHLPPPQQRADPLPTSTPGEAGRRLR